MAVEQRGFEIPAFGDFPGDDQLGATGVSLEDPTYQEMKAYWKWAAESARHRPMDSTLQPYKTSYDEYLAEGKQALGVAVQNEVVFGLDYVVDLYRVAQIKFLDALGRQPIKSSDPDVPCPDPIVLLYYGTCLGKQAQSSWVEPYKSPESHGRNRHEDLKRRAPRALHTAWEMIMGEVDPNDETFVPAAVVAAGGLKAQGNPEEAKKVLAEAKQELVTHDTDPHMVEFIDKHATTDGSDRLYPRRVVEATALLDLTTQSHRVLAMC